MTMVAFGSFTYGNLYRYVFRPIIFLVVILTAYSSFQTQTWGRQDSRKIRLLVVKPELKDDKSTLQPSAFLERLLAELQKDEFLQADVLEVSQTREQIEKLAGEGNYDYFLLTTISGIEDKSIGGKLGGFIRKGAKKVPVAGDKVDANLKFKVTVEYSLQAVRESNLKFSNNFEATERSVEDAVRKVITPMCLEILNKIRENISKLPAPVITQQTNEQNIKPVSVRPGSIIRSNTSDLRLVVQTSHSTMVTDYAYSRDGKLLATLSSDGIIKLWNTELRVELATFSGYRTVGIAFSPDGDILAALGKDDGVRLFDVRTGKFITRLTEIGRSKPKGEKNIADLFNESVSIAFGPNGRTLVTGGDTGVRVWDVIERRLQYTLLKDEYVPLVAISPDGVSIAAVVNENKIHVYSSVNGKKQNDFHSGVGKVTALEFSQDGRTLILGSRYGTIRLYDFSKNKEIVEPPVYSKCEKPFELDRKAYRIPKILIPLPIGGIVKNIDLACEISKDVKGLLQKGWTVYYENSIRSVTLSPDGNLLAWSYGDNKVHVADVRTRNLLYIIPAEYDPIDNPVSAIKAMVKAAQETGKEQQAARQELQSQGTGQTSASKSESNVESNNSGPEATSAGLLVSTFFRETAPVRFSTDGKYINSVRQFKTIARWDARTGESKLSLAVSNRDLSGGFPFPMPWGSVPVFDITGDKLLTGSLTKGIKRWDLKYGMAPQQITSVFTTGNNLPLSPDAKLSVQVIPDRSNPKEKDKLTIIIKDAEKDEVIKSFSINAMGVEPAFSPDNRFLALKIYERGNYLAAALWLRVYDISAATPKQVFEKKHASHFTFSNDSKLMALRLDKDESYTWPLASKKDDLRIVDVEKWVELPYFKERAEDGESGAFASRVVFNSDASLLATADDTVLKVWDVKTGKVTYQHDLEVDSDLSNMVFHPTKNILTYTTYRSLHHWDLASNQVMTPPLLTDFWGNLTYSPDGGTLALGGAENRVRLFDVRELSRITEIGSLIMPSANDWLVITPEGRLDTSRLEEVSEVHWIMPGQPFVSQPLELFMRDYYEPRLLPRLVAGDTFPELADLSSRNRTLPEVAITGITPQAPDVLNVTVQVKNTYSQSQFDERKRQLQSGAFDLRLFRDGQLVGYADGSLLTNNASEFSRTFSVRLPHVENKKDFLFSTYAFNNERVKSLSVTKTYQLPAPLPVRKGKVYLISMGVNLSENERFNLRFAANDARQMQTGLAARLMGTGRYSEVIQIPLISDTKMVNGKTVIEINATKEALHAIFDRLAGRASPIPAKLVTSIPGLSRLERATPDDLVLFSFAGHGFADQNGAFYIVPSNIGKDQQKGLADMLPQCISSDELALWLRDVDVADLVMVIDACHSAASIEGSGFKPGPMGSRGLGQLAYDKGMQILAATQKNDYALEADRLEQGLLTYALIADGVGGGKADYNPKDQKIMIAEWLRYGVRRVPELYQDVRDMKRSVVVGGKAATRSDLATIDPKQPDIQQPALFDFLWRRSDALLLNVK